MKSNKELFNKEMDLQHEFRDKFMMLMFRVESVAGDRPYVITSILMNFILDRPEIQEVVNPETMDFIYATDIINKWIDDAEILFNLKRH